MMAGFVDRERLACELLGVPALDEGGYAPCPGIARHSKRDGRRDFRVRLDDNPAPCGFCLHASCEAEVAEFNRALSRAIWLAEERGLRPDLGRVRRAAAVEPRRRQVFVPAQLHRVAGDLAGVVSARWFGERSPLEPFGVSAEGFFGSVYEPGERVCVVGGALGGWGSYLVESLGGGAVSVRGLRCRMRWGGEGCVESGDPVREVAAGRWEFWGRYLGDGVRRGQMRCQVMEVGDVVGGIAVRDCEQGFFFLAQPVDGLARFNGEGLSWRSEANVTDWRFFVLESDEAGHERYWAALLARLPVPVVAIYSSGGRSLHALVRHRCGSKAEWDAERDSMRRFLVRMGADRKALSAVRLTRVPNLRRSGRLQKLLFLNPSADGTPIEELPVLRDLAAVHAGDPAARAYYKIP